MCMLFDCIGFGDKDPSDKERSLAFYVDDAVARTLWVRRGSSDVSSDLLMCNGMNRTMFIGYTYRRPSCATNVCVGTFAL